MFDSGSQDFKLPYNHGRANRPDFRPVVGILRNPKAKSEKLEKKDSEKIERIRSILDGLGLDALVIDASKVKLREIPDIVDQCDGFLFTGGRSNVHPHRYGKKPINNFRHTFDRQRDAASDALTRLVIKRDIPALWICRGFQELVTILGGKLEQNISKVTNVNHRFGYDHPRREAQPIHPIDVAPGGLLSKMWNHSARLVVNSIHEQGALVSKLPRRLRVEAQWKKVVEAVSYPRNCFAFGVQFHPEKDSKNPFYKKIFEAFGAAVNTHAQDKLVPATRADSRITMGTKSVAAVIG